MAAGDVSTRTLTGGERAAVLALADRIETEDGAPPLSDQSRSRIGAAGGTDLSVWDGAELGGYARLDAGDGGDVAEIAALADAVAPLLTAVLDASHGAALVWSHGTRSRLTPAVQAAGLVARRELYRLELDVASAELPSPGRPPDGVAIRAFVPGTDDEQWLALNAAAFAHHPEQGSWTVADLRARVAEPWFDPAGFFLAERDGELIGFHWTKVHPDGAGEVYVLGIAPGAQGLGLGALLLAQGLRHLADRGCRRILLYVDGDNTAALRLYERAGFIRADVDIQWQLPAQGKPIETADNEPAS